MIHSLAMDVEIFPNLFSVTFVDMASYLQMFADCIDENGKPIPLSSKLSVKEIATNKFVKAFMDSSWFQKGLSQNTSGGAIQNVASVSILKTLEIPLPSLKTQQEIVEKLDAFENLIQSLDQEIKLRKQQYEYYREKLLTFEKE